MRAEMFKVEPFSYIEFREVQIFKAVNNHATAFIKGILDKDTDENLLERMSPNEVVTIRAYSYNGEEMVIFKGLICKIALSTDDGLKSLEVQASSHTCLMDIKKNICIFQNTEQTFSEIAKYMGGKDRARVICTKGKEQNIGGIVVQYQETDWEFLKRLASKLNTTLVADCINGRISFSFGPPKSAKKELHEFTSYSVRNLKEYYDQINTGREECRESDTFSLMVKTRELLDLCDLVLISGREYYVKSVECQLDRNELVNSYELVTIGGMKVSEVFNSEISGISLEGAVDQVQQDRIRIRFPQDADQPCVWFPYVTAYSSPDGTGWYCMPEVGDAVRVYFCDSDERHAVAINMIHLTCDIRENPDIKYIRSSYGKEIRFEPSALRMTNNKGISIILDDKRGITLKSSADIVGLAEGDVWLHGGKEMQIIGDKGVTVRQGDNKIEIKDGINQTAKTITQK